MQINGVDLSSLGVQLYDRILSSNNVETTQDWLEGDVQPTYIRQQDKFKSVKLRFLITESDENEAFLIMSRLTMLLKKATIKFDDLDLFFDVTLNGHTSQERLKNGNFILTVPLLSDYAKGSPEIYTTDARATDNFQLNVLYYKDSTTLLGTKKVLIRAAQFTGQDSLESIGIDVNEFIPDYYANGIATNFIGRAVTYEELYALQTLIINYVPNVYTKELEYFIVQNDSSTPIISTTMSFTKKQVDDARTIGSLVNLSFNKPNGYRAYTNFDLELTFDNFMSFAPLQVYYEEIVNERTKEITVDYYVEGDNNTTTYVNSQTIVAREGNIVDGTTLSNLINLNAYKPQKYYNDGVCGEDINALVTFDDLESNYAVTYYLSTNSILVEYYLNSYPNWSRVATATYNVKYQTSYDQSEHIITDVGINVNRYLTSTYNSGIIRNGESVETFDDLLSTGVLQIYYTPKDYTLRVYYAQDETSTILDYRDVQINDYMFISQPTLGEVININELRPEGYIFDPTQSYDGDVSLDALLAASPITITYIPVAEVRTKSILVKYKQEFASAYSTINTSVITIEESEVGGGIRLKDLMNLNQYRPDYYDAGIIDGYSENSVVLFDEIQGTYDILYLASSYSTQVRYYTDDVDNANWIGSDTINYKVIDFSVETTLIDLGLNIDLFKPSYCGSGEVQYHGPVTFSALRNLDAINIIYEAVEEPEDPSGIDYPHRILFLQHNDMGDFESLYPTWTLNHAYINTGVTCQDMSKLTVLCNTFRVFDTTPLYNVNVGDAYLFGSSTPRGSYYIKYVNNTSFKSQDQITGVNTFNVAAGYGTPQLVVEESASEGFSANTGITASAREGYSYATLTYTNLVQSNSAPMDAPLYLFACDQNGYYRGGIAGVGIKSCKIYYDNTLIRDFVPVAYYDKIGDKIAPSNCLYDKVSQTFFEDARGLDSFNIMDDPDYEDTNPEHMIGCCYVNYYKDNTMFQSNVVMFRGSDFVDQTYDPYEKFIVDYYQPQYYGSGEIQGLPQDITFNNLNGQIFNVIYHSTGYNVTVNYWKDDTSDPSNLLGTETITLTEKDFAQVPTFGQIIDIQKYKPDSYKASYTYPETKVTLGRILEHAPYDIVYQEVENPEVYTTKITYLRRKYGVDVTHPENIYENLGYITLELDETEFADGVYIEKFIDFNARKPASSIPDKPFYLDGTPFEWYLEDDMLITPEDLKEEYKIAYEPVVQYLDVNYYTDEVDDENLIASATWAYAINDWPDGESFQIVDELPNTYIDRYKPVICGGGRFENPSQWWTFETLTAAGEIAIIYDTLEEPHDPDSASFPKKVIFFNRNDQDNHGQTGLNWTQTFPNISLTKGYQVHPEANNVYNPYIDIGYKPKELRRLKIETKAYALNSGNAMGSNSYGYAGDSYDYFLGYYGAVAQDDVINYLGTNQQAANNILLQYKDRESVSVSEWSPASSGWMAVKGHSVRSAGLVYTTPMPQYFDGWPTYNLNTNMMNTGYNTESVRELAGGWRNGYHSTKGDNLEDLRTYLTYWITRNEGYHRNGSVPTNSFYSIDENGNAIYDNKDPRMTGTWTPNTLNPDAHNDTPISAVVFNPLTITLDAWNNYMEIYDYTDSQNPRYVNVDNQDIDIFSRRCVPKGTLSLFVTTNPDTGKLNWLPYCEATYLPVAVGLYGTLEHEMSFNTNPWDPEFKSSFEVQQMGVVGSTKDTPGHPSTAGHGSGGSQSQEWENTVEVPIYGITKKTIQVTYARYQVGVFNAPIRCMVWYVKVWDRDKLVRHMIPVAQGDMIYDYVMPANGMFDIVTETFYGNQNSGGTYEWVQGSSYHSYTNTRTVRPEEVYPLEVKDDPTIWGQVVVNYYDENNNFIANQYVDIPVHHKENNESIEEILHYNDYKPNDFYHDGMIDTDLDIYDPNYDEILEAIYHRGSVNIYYKLRTFTKTVVYYQGNTRVGSKDLFYTIQDIQDAETLADLGIDTTLYASPDYKPGRIYFNEQVIADDDIQTFIDASSPIVVYDEYSKVERPDLLYLNYYRQGAYDNTLITPDEDPNYLDCDLDAVVLNPNGAVKYVNHYHSALYEDEVQDYFIAYQVDVMANWVGVYKGPARKYGILAEIVDKGRYTIVEERNGWGRLREYHNGWILLSYTQKATSPGQNPDYTAPAANQLVVPFGDEITITKLTIDRLWCYSPEVASWIKAEDISFNQSGRLYNGLATTVIHLDDVEDWSAIESLDDLEIYPQAYKLKYHDYCPYTYEGSYTYAAFSDIHSIDFVYPETIYVYNVIYYKDTVDDETEIGRETFSCSMSDWNPDWDTFIATSWKYDEHDFPINPTMYRDTELTLTWDYFGIDKNEYKPVVGNYDDGIFLWNPRSYNNTDVYFTFEEIVTTGVQKILYVHTLQNYKLVTTNGCAPVLSDLHFAFNTIPGEFNTPAGIWDIEWKKGEALNVGGYGPDAPIGLYEGGGIHNFYYYDSYDPTLYYNLAQGHAKDMPILTSNRKYVITNISNKRNTTSVYSWGNDVTGYQSPYYAVRRSGGHGLSQEVQENDVALNKTVNMKNEEFNQLRQTKYLANIVDQYEDWLLAHDDTGLRERGDRTDLITHAENNTYPKFTWTDWNGVTRYSQPYLYVHYTPGSEDFFRVYQNWNLTTIEDLSTQEIKNLTLSGSASNPFYYLKIWRNYELEHYYVPVARGEWLEDGRQVPYNTVYDIITNTIIECSDTSAAYNNKVFAIGEEAVETNVYSPFDSWDFDYDDCNYTVQATVDTQRYQYPDVYAARQIVHPQNTIIPVRRTTSDSANRVTGQWFFDGEGWFQASDVTILPSGDFTVTDITPRRTIAVKGDTVDTEVLYNSYINPNTGATTTQRQFLSDATTDILYECGNYYWTANSEWIPISYTEDNYTVIDKNYVVSVDSLKVYRYPIMNQNVVDTYQTGVLLSGDRIHATKKLFKDENWQYIEYTGWIRVENAVQELIN